MSNALCEFDKLDNALREGTKHFFNSPRGYRILITRDHYFNKAHCGIKLPPLHFGCFFFFGRFFLGVSFFFGSLFFFTSALHFERLMNLAASLASSWRSCSSSVSSKSASWSESSLRPATSSSSSMKDESNEPSSDSAGFFAALALRGGSLSSWENCCLCRGLER